MPLIPINIDTPDSGGGDNLYTGGDKSNKNNVYLEKLIIDHKADVIKHLIVMHEASSAYKAGAIVARGGQLYTAKNDIPAKAFDIVDWIFPIMQIGKNLLSNGNFSVWQRGTSFSDSRSNVYTADRWRVSSGSSGTYDVSNPASNVLRIESTEHKDSTFLGIRQTLPDLQELNGQTITLSAFVKTNVAGKVALRIQRVSSTDYHPGDGTWKKMTYIVTRSDFVKYTDFGILIYPGAATTINDGDYIEVKDFQLELGSVATLVEILDPAIQLLKCRYFYRMVGGTTAIFDAVLYEAHAPYDWKDMYKTPTPKLLNGIGKLVKLGREVFDIKSVKLNEDRGLIDLETITAGGEAGIAIALLPDAVALDSEIYE